MQLRAAIALFLLFAPARAAAQSGLGVVGTFFHERGDVLNMTVVNPSIDVSADLGEAVAIGAGYEADIVSGASVAVVDAPASGVDVIASATKLDDVRHTVSGSLSLRSEHTSMTVGYGYGYESDYRSHGVSVSGRAEMFERNTTFELSYGRGFDRVCNLHQPRAREAVDRRRLDSSDGCFGGSPDTTNRASDRLSLQTFQGSWTQAWSPILVTQLTLTTQLLRGFQGNPYRAVWLGRSAAQENHPADRARYAAGLGARLWIEPLEGAFILRGRLYRDTWDVASVTGEAAYEQSILEGLRLQVRGRFYTQTGAVFYSDDYAFQPKGQYFTGDRELSPMQSWTIGGRIEYGVPSDEDGHVLGFLTEMSLIAKADLVLGSFDEFHYGRVEVPNDTALIVTLGLETVF